MKDLIESDEEKAKDLLLENPQFTQALLLIFMDFHWLSTEDVGHLANPISNTHVEKDNDMCMDVDVNIEMKTMETINCTNNSLVQNKENVQRMNNNKFTSCGVKISADHQSVLQQILKMS